MGFYAIGAYITAILNTSFHIPILVLLPVSALAAGLFAWMVTAPVIHLKGDYLCIVTIGIGEIVRLTMINNPFGLTGGPNGIYGIDTPVFIVPSFHRAVLLPYMGADRYRHIRPCAAPEIPGWAGLELHTRRRGRGGGPRHKCTPLQAGCFRPGGRHRGNGRQHLRIQTDVRIAGKLYVHGVIPPVLHRPAGRPRLHSGDGAGGPRYHHLPGDIQAARPVPADVFRLGAARHDDIHARRTNAETA